MCRHRGKYSRRDSFSLRAFVLDCEVNAIVIHLIGRFASAQRAGTIGASIKVIESWQRESGVVKVSAGASHGPHGHP